MKRGWKRRLGWLVGGLGVVTLTLLAAGWMMFHHVPTWYAPTLIDPADLQSVRDDLGWTFSELSEHLVNTDDPFEQRFTQDQINAWIAAREEMDPMSREWLPREMSDPFVRIDSEGLRVAVTYNDGGVRVVVSALFAVTADREGVRVRLAEVAGGSLPIPDSWIQEQLNRLGDRGLSRQDWISGQWDDRPLPRVSDLLDEAVFSNAYSLSNVNRPFRIVGVRCDPGELVVTFAPEPRQTVRRSQPVEGRVNEARPRVGGLREASRAN